MSSIDKQSDYRQPELASKVGYSGKDSGSSIEEDSSIVEGTLDQYIAEQIAQEEGNGIKYRTCGVFKTSALLFSEFICLAIVSFPWAYSVLGLIPGIILTVFVALTALYTGLTLWKFCLRNPTVLDICDIGQMLVGGRRWGWYFTAFIFSCNNIFICGFHLLTWSKWMSTMIGDSGICPIIWTVVAFVVCFVCSLPRTLASLSWIAVFSAVTMGISAIMVMVFAGVQSEPNAFDPASPVVLRLWPKEGTTFVEGMSAALNILYLFIGQCVFSSVIAEQKDPRKFHIALKMVTVTLVVFLLLVGSLGYYYFGDYSVAPAYGSLQPVYKKIAFTFTVPTTIFVGVMYCSITARLVFFRVFRGTRHIHENTVTGWAGWCAILLVIWAIAFVIAEAIPFFSDLLSLLSSCFDSFMGYYYWGLAYFQMKNQDLGPGWWKKRQSPMGYVHLFLNCFWFVMGTFMLTVGTYATAQSIKNNFDAGLVGGAFSCAFNGL